MFGIPVNLIYDRAAEQVGSSSEFQRFMHNFHNIGNKNEPYTQRHNQAEDSIWELKQRWGLRIMRQCVPKKLWDFGIVWEAQIMLITARVRDKIPGLEKTTGDTVNIRKWLDFEFYKLCSYWDNPHD